MKYSVYIPVLEVRRNLDTDSVCVSDEGTLRCYNRIELKNGNKLDRLVMAFPPASWTDLRKENDI